MIHCITEPKLILKEISRILVKGGMYHIIAEDYGMIYGYPNTDSIDVLFNKHAKNFFDSDGCDGYIVLL
jgi:ubiquinone/menaquinone biosynthesis C-methylase UbiE